MRGSRFGLICWLLILPLFAACYGPSGPKQVLVFQATALPGAKGIELDRTKTLIEGRLRSAELKCRFHIATTGNDKIDVTTHGATHEELEKIKLLVMTNATLEFAALADPETDADIIDAAQDADREVWIDGVLCGAWIPESSNGEHEMGVFRLSDKLNILPQHRSAIYRMRESGERQRCEWLVVYDPEWRITGELLQEVSEIVDADSRPAISFTLTPEGAKQMKALTTFLTEKQSRVRNLAIIFNDEIDSAPNLMKKISGYGEINGDFTQEELKLKVVMLRSGQLPCQLTLVKQTAEDPPQQ